LSSIPNIRPQPNIGHRPALRDYQRNGDEEVRQLLRAGKRRILIVASTGSGKGTWAADLVTRAAAKGKRTIFLVNRREIVFDFSRRLDGLGLDHGVIMANHPRRAPWLPVHVASIDTLRRRNPPPADILILDECHFSVSQGWLDVLAKYPEAIVLGTTATPIRADGKGLGEIFEVIVEWPPMCELIDRGHLVPARVYAPSSPDLAGVHTARGDFDQKELAEVCDKPRLVGDIVEHWTRLAADRPTVVFAVDRNHAHHIADELNTEGHKFVYVDANTQNRQAIWDDLTERRIQGVVSIGIISYGWDLPACACAVLARPTQSVALYLQQVGRVLRPSPGKTDCIAEGELVLTDKGLVPIEQVTTGMRLWDGVEWVSHDGAICKGESEVITYAGLTATPEHGVWTQEGWKAFGECAAKQIPIAQTGLGRHAVRAGRSYISGSHMARPSRQPENVCFRALHDMWTRGMDILREFVSWTDSTRTMGDPVQQTQGRVWDILNAGPLHRFTVSGILVHNCLILDHAGNTLRHGFPDDPREWSLEGSKRRRGREEEESTGVRVCMQCWFTFRSTLPACPACGWIAPKQVKEVEVIAGDLTELTREAVARELLDKIAGNVNFLDLVGFRRVANERGYKRGYPAMQYRLRHGQWPPRGWMDAAALMVDPVDAPSRQELLEGAGPEGARA